MVFTRTIVIVDFSSWYRSGVEVSRHEFLTSRYHSKAESDDLQIIKAVDPKVCVPCGIEIAVILS